jgi:hypothetical protein
MADENRRPLRQAKQRVREAARRLEEVRSDLLDTVGGLPLPASALDKSELRKLSEVSELDALVRCAIHDHLEPLISALRGIAQAKGGARQNGHQRRRPHALQ